MAAVEKIKHSVESVFKDVSYCFNIKKRSWNCLFLGLSWYWTEYFFNGYNLNITEKMFSKIFFCRSYLTVRRGSKIENTYAYFFKLLHVSNVKFDNFGAQEPKLIEYHFGNLVVKIVGPYMSMYRMNKSVFLWYSSSNI
jgi:hypothetical protein